MPNTMTYRERKLPYKTRTRSRCPLLAARSDRTISSTTSSSNFDIQSLVATRSSSRNGRYFDRTTTSSILLEILRFKGGIPFCGRVVPLLCMIRDVKESVRLVAPMCLRGSGNKGTTRWKRACRGNVKKQKIGLMAQCDSGDKIKHETIYSTRRDGFLEFVEPTERLFGGFHCADESERESMSLIKCRQSDGFNPYPTLLTHHHVHHVMCTITRPRYSVLHPMLVYVVFSFTSRVNDISLRKSVNGGINKLVLKTQVDEFGRLSLGTRRW